VGAWSSRRRHDIILGVLRNRIPADFLIVLILTLPWPLSCAAMLEKLIIKQHHYNQIFSHILSLHKYLIA
jgi:hypothetical protein